MATIKKIAWFGVLPSLLLLYIAYLAAYEVLEEVMPYVIYTGGGAIIIIILGIVYLFFEMVRTRKTQLWATREMSRIDVSKAGDMAKKERILVITAKRDEQVFINDPDENSIIRAAHKNAKFYINGQLEAPTDLELAMHNQFYGSGRQQIESGPIDQQGNDIDNITPVELLQPTGWIERVILPAPHVHFCGATRSGKTTLANHLIEHISKQDQGAKFYLLNPKDTAARKPFIIEPNFSDISEAIEGLETFNQLMVQRKNNPNLTKDTHKIVFVIDEWDWVFQAYGVEATRLFIPLVKVGAELNIKVILIGQSPLTGDTGLSQSLYHNMVRVAIWQEGGRLLNNYQLNRNYKQPLLDKYEQLKSYAPEFKSQAGYDLRYCAVVPMAGNPTVEVIPYLSDPHPIKKSPEAIRNIPTRGSYDAKVCIAWASVIKEHRPSCNKLHKLITGKDVNVNARQRQNYRDTLNKYGINPQYF